ncbi:hypothetical protein MASR2M78_10880 [Treponema sp.]|jgi:ADP-ribose pyrophosphatase YjhB (NUDIX family)
MLSMNLNPFPLCPSCGSSNVHFKQGKAFSCSTCGFIYYHNVATAAGVLIETRGKLLCIVRSQEPGLGLLALPGGFVDPGERAEAAVKRECLEEIGWTPDELRFLASFPNQYFYKDVLYNTCDLFFVAQVDNLQESDLRFDPHEASEIRFIDPDDIQEDELAFDSTRRVLAAYKLTRLKNQAG